MSLKSVIEGIWSISEKSARRPARAAGVGGDWSPAANFNIFTVTGGPVRITGMFGHVRAVFAGANATPIISVAPSDVAAAWTDICVIAVAAAFPLNSLLVWDGSLTAVSGVLRASVALGHDQASDSVGTPATAMGWAGYIHLIPAVIRITNAGAADATGQVDWYITYKPMVANARIVPVP